MLLKCILKKWDWIDLAQDRDRRRAVVNVVMKRRVSYIAGDSLTS